MPNGHSGSFPITREEFKRLLRELPGDSIVGKMLGGPVSAATASDVMSLLEMHEERLILIEEQDYAWYTVPLSQGRWVMVEESSPLHPTLRRYFSFRGMLSRWFRK